MKKRRGGRGRIGGRRRTEGQKKGMKVNVVENWMHIK